MAGGHDDRDPITAADRWLDLVLAAGDIPRAWPLTDPALRRELVAAWADANADHYALAGFRSEAMADALSRPYPTHRLWAAFAVTQALEFANMWIRIDLSVWEWVMRTRPVAPDMEMAVLMNVAAPMRAYRSGLLVRSLGLIMHFTQEDGWLVAGFQGDIPAD